MIDTLLLFTQFLLIIAISFVISFYSHIYINTCSCLKSEQNCDDPLFYCG